MEKKMKHTHIKENTHIFKIRILFYFEPTFIEISKNTDPELRMYKHNHINKRNLRTFWVLKCDLFFNQIFTFLIHNLANFKLYYIDFIN